jgi:hypothetical protein
MPGLGETTVRGGSINSWARLDEAGAEVENAMWQEQEVKKSSAAVTSKRLDGKLQVLSGNGFRLTSYKVTIPITLAASRG